jgi:hypothetical protein
MRWARNVTHMEILEMRTKFWLETLKGREHSEELGVDGWIMYLKETGFEVVDKIHVAQDRDQWQLLVNTVMNILFP